jgi:hypothetical protein
MWGEGGWGRAEVVAIRFEFPDTLLRGYRKTLALGTPDNELRGTAAL